MNATTIARWAYAHVESHLDALPNITTEEGFYELSWRQQVRAVVHFFCAMPFALIVLGLCRINPTLWKDI